MSWFNNKQQPRIIKVEDPTQVEKLCRLWDRYIDNKTEEKENLRRFWAYADSVCNFPNEGSMWMWKNPRFEGTFVIFEERI